MYHYTALRHQAIFTCSNDNRNPTCSCVRESTSPPCVVAEFKDAKVG